MALIRDVKISLPPPQIPGPAIPPLPPGPGGVPGVCAARLLQGGPADAGPERVAGPAIQQHRDRVGHQGARRHAALRPARPSGVKRGPEGKRPEGVGSVGGGVWGWERL